MIDHKQIVGTSVKVTSNTQKGNVMQFVTFSKSLKFNSENSSLLLLFKTIFIGISGLLLQQMAIRMDID